MLLADRNQERRMSRLRINAFSVSLDGYGAGPRQSLQAPLGEGGEELHEWMFPTDTARKRIFGGGEGTKGVDDDFAAAGFENVGAWILGRNMFAHSRGPWADDGWVGWWGDEPPYHCDTYVLTHHARPPIEMKGGTTFTSSPTASRRRWSARGARRAAGT
jgi:dihydrofolate reductase